MAVKHHYHFAVKRKLKKKNFFSNAWLIVCIFSIFIYKTTRRRLRRRSNWWCYTTFIALCLFKQAQYHHGFYFYELEVCYELHINQSAILHLTFLKDCFGFHVLEKTVMTDSDEKNRVVTAFVFTWSKKGLDSLMNIDKNQRKLSLASTPVWKLK